MQENLTNHQRWGLDENLHMFMFRRLGYIRIQRASTTRGRSTYLYAPSYLTLPLGKVEHRSSIMYDIREKITGSWLIALITILDAGK